MAVSLGAIRRRWMYWPCPWREKPSLTAVSAENYGSQLMGCRFCLQPIRLHDPTQLNSTLNMFRTLLLAKNCWISVESSWVGSYIWVFPLRRLNSTQLNSTHLHGSTVRVKSGRAVVTGLFKGRLSTRIANVFNSKSVVEKTAENISEKNIGIA